MDIFLKTLRFTFLVLVTLGLFLILNYFLLIPISIHSIGAWVYLAIFISIIALLHYYDSNIVKGNDMSILNIILFSSAILVFVILLIVTFFNSSIFRAKDYANIISIQDGNFNEDIPDLANTEIMDIDTAINIGSRVMGEIGKDNVSQYIISDEYNMIVYQGRTYRVSPLEYTSKIKAWGNKGITGYVLVDCQTQEAKLVKLEEKMKYVPSAIFNYNLTRHIRESYPSVLLGKYQFEIDEEGNPYYIVPTYKTTIGLFSGKVLDKVLIINTITGKIDEYNLNEVPDWIEHIYSIEDLAKLASNYYEYQNGFFNSITSQKDVKRLSYNFSDSDFMGYSSIKTNKGIEYFTGITSTGKDESIVGFLFLNPRDGKITFYDCVGAEEASAMSSAEALVQNYGYTASYPFVVNINGIETYFVALKDKTGTNKAYSLVNVKNYTIAVQASTKEEVIKQYINLVEKKNTSQNNNTTKSEKITSKITNIYTAIENSTTYYYYSLEGYEELFVSSILNDRNQVKLKVGDTITVDTDYIDSYYIVKSIEL